METLIQQRVKNEIERRESMLATGHMGAMGTSEISGQGGRRSRGNSNIAGNDGHLDDEVYLQNKSKLAVLVSDDFLDIKIDEGQDVSLEFTVRNES